MEGEVLHGKPPGGHRRTPRLASLFAVAPLCLVSAPVRAQVRSDVGACASSGFRVRSDTPDPVAATAGGAIYGHVALVPLVRAGGYAGLEQALPNGAERRQYYTVGLDAKVASPWTRAPWRAWAFLGVGAAYVVATRHAATTGASPTGPGPSQSSQVDGALLELPVGVGAGLRFHSAWEIAVVLSLRPALANLGPVTRPSAQRDPQPFAGHEVLAVSLAVGVSFCR
jgi:hypothetical protein